MTRSIILITVSVAIANAIASGRTQQITPRPATADTVYHKIYLNKTPGDQPGFYQLRFANLTDSSYLKITYSEDMGKKSGSYYLFKPNTPDGTYLIYTNDTLVQKSTYLQTVLHGTTTYYHANGRAVIRYNNGKKMDEANYYRNGGLKDRSVNIGEHITAIARYSNDGSLTHNGLYYDHKTFRYEYFKNNKFTALSFTKNNRHITENINKDSSLNNTSFYHFDTGTLTVSYRINHMADIRWDDK